MERPNVQKRRRGLSGHSALAVDGAIIGGTGKNVKEICNLVF